MTILTRSQLRQLTGLRADAAISLYMPVEPTYACLGENLARLESLIQNAEQQLVGLVGGSTAQDLLEPFRQLREHELFWCASGDGLAAFASPHWFRAFRIPWRLEESIHVGNRLCVTPLLPLLETGGRYYVLALQDESARLYEATEQSIQQISLPLRVVAETESLARVDVTARSATRRIHLFCRQVAVAVNEVLQCQDAPLVLACAGYLAHSFQDHNCYEHLIKAKVPGNASLWSVDELRQRAWEHVAPIFRQQKEQALRLFHEGVCSNLTACDAKEIVTAADEGRVRMLLLNRKDVSLARIAKTSIADNGIADNGIADNGIAENRIAENKSQAMHVDWLGHAVTQTLNHGGSVYRVDSIPTHNSPVAALLRS